VKVAMLSKYGIMDKETIRRKLDVIKQNPKRQVQAYYDKTKKFFRKGKLQDVKQKKRLLL